MAHDDLIGQTIGAYEIERKIGAGGMGTVWLARQPEIGARVAIKVVNPKGEDREDYAARLFAEARAVNLINHECIVNILDMVRLDDGRPALVMEYLSGAPLDQLIAKEEPLPEEAVVEIVLDVLSAIGAAHQRGILHRDLKPANVIVTPRGRAKVLDFGMSKSLRDHNPMSTDVGVVVGTPVYMSPEQALGDEIDERGDLFSTGLIAYEALTGERVYKGPSLVAVTEQHLQPITDLRELRADLGDEIAEVVLTSLEVVPDRRYQTAAAMAAALRAAIGPRVKSSLLFQRRIRDTAQGLDRLLDEGDHESDHEGDDGGDERAAETVLERPSRRPAPVQRQPADQDDDEDHQDDEEDHEGDGEDPGGDDQPDDPRPSPWRSSWLLFAAIFGVLTLGAIGVNSLCNDSAVESTSDSPSSR